MAKGFKKVPQYEDILKVQLENTHKYLYLPERYIFQATQVAESSRDMERELLEQKMRVHRAFRADADDRMGDMPVPLERLVRGERGEQGEVGQRGETGQQGPTGPMGPPGAPTRFDLDPVLRVMQQRLDESEATRARARDMELQDELSLIRAEAQRHAETSRVLAQATANLTSIPSELRAVAEATARREPVDTLSHLREAAAHYERRARENHETNVQFLQRNAFDLAQFAGQMGTSVMQAFQNFKPPERDIVMVQQPPPPPPPPAAGRIKRAAMKALPPPPRPVQPDGGPPEPPAPSGRPGGSSDPLPADPRPVVPHAAPGTFDFGGPSTRPAEERRRADERSRAKWAAQSRFDPYAKLEKEKDAKKPPAGLSIQGTTKDHTEELTKHGKKPIVDPKKPEPKKPEPKKPEKKPRKPRMVPSIVNQELARLDRGAARYDSKRKREDAPATKNRRRVTATDV